MRYRSGARRLLLVLVMVSLGGGVYAWTNDDHGLPGIERLLRRVANAVGVERAVTNKRTRLLLPFVTNTAGFDTGVAVANTGLDSSGTVGKAGTCTIYYFGTTGAGPAPAPQTTNAPLAPGQSLTFVVSSGGTHGLVGTPNFQGYIEILCEFPFAHGFGFMTDGPIGTARVGSTIPAIVLPLNRQPNFLESAGQ
jgi:hypothetical protein